MCRAIYPLLMKSIFAKSVFFCAIFTLLITRNSLAGTITVGNVDPGPYGPGSSIAVPITADVGCVTAVTIYNLYLSDASGNFDKQTLIGTFAGFYATYVNGTIPAGTPSGTGYMVRVISVDPSVTSTTSTAFSINGSTGVTASISSQLLITSSPGIFGNCNGADNTPYTFNDQSTAGSTVTAVFFNELSKTTEATLSPTAAGVTFVAKAAQYTIIVKAVNGGIVGTQAFFLINNVVNTSFGVTGNNSICLTGGGSLVYNVDITSANGIQNNFPGLLYTITWGDGKSDIFSICDIQASGGRISHQYTKSSCGNNPNGQNNSFEVDLQASNPYCGSVGTQVTSYAQVVTAPVNRFKAPVAACVNTPVTFGNISDPGQDPKSTQSSCQSLSALYTWMVDGNTVASNLTLTQPLIYTFTTPGTHSIKLHLQNGNNLCTVTDTTQTICIQNPPQPKFILPVTHICLPTIITPVNNSVIDSNCNASNNYVWTVTGPGGVTYAGGTTANSANPQFAFTNSGSYHIQLGITTVSCGTVLAPAQTVIVDSIAFAKLSPDTTLCGSNQMLNFNTSKGVTQTMLKGNALNTPATYNWTISGGNYSFTGGTSDTSKYPQILFTDFTTYTVTVSNTNTCSSPAVAVQHLTFKEAPTVNAGADQTFCANKQAILNGTVTGTAASTVWLGGTGAFTPGRNTLNPTYTPSTAEINAGGVKLTLVAVTSLAFPCDSIKSSVNLLITKPDSITSAKIDTVCSGLPVNYQITATLPNSTFNWVVDAANTSPNATGYATTGNGTTINDVITNNDPINFSKVTYNITAVGGTGCGSNTFVLVVSIAPKQAVAKFTQDVTNGCDTVKVQFTNQSTPVNTLYTWNFGDGSSTSTVANPSHTFLARTDGKDTTYTVTLNLTPRCGSAVPFTSTVLVRPKTPIAYISPKQITGCSPFTLAVDNFSPGTNQSYDYYLYDGSTLVQQITVKDKEEIRFNPIITNSTKQYTLYMVATGFCGTTGESTIIPITISASNITAQMFLQDGLDKGCAPFTATFINNSFGADTYYYTIYDVNNNVVDRRQGGTVPLPYTFGTPGTYYVTITAANSCSTIESTPKIRIDVETVPAPQFVADITTGCKTVTVNFTNQTAGDPNTQATALIYDWDFGDGSPHSLNFTPPPHTYTFKNSPFTVTLTATNAVTNCSAVVSKTALINVTAPPFTAFSEEPDSVITYPNYHFSFIDETTGNPVLWKWNFGDGQTSTSENPGHTYIDTGVYKVSLTTAGQSGCDSTLIKTVRITGVPGQLFFPNAFEPSSATADLRVFMPKGSGIKFWHLQIFNTFSQLIWETTNLDSKGAPVDGWDGTFKGTQAPQGVYIWQASATFINGTQWKGNTIGNSLPKRTGTINLIR